MKRLSGLGQQRACTLDRTDVKKKMIQEVKSKKNK